MLFSDGSDFPDVVDEADVSFRRPVALADVNVAKSVQKFSPCVHSDSISDRCTHFVLPIIVFLKRRDSNSVRQS